MGVLGHDSWSSSLRQRLLRKLLQLFFDHDEKNQPKIEDSTVRDVIGQVLLHFDQENRLTSIQLGQLISVCMEEIKSRQVELNPRWLPILSKLFSMCNDFETILDLADDRDVPGSQFRYDSISLFGDF
jgi:hypothetical protein